MKTQCRGQRTLTRPRFSHNDQRIAVPFQDAAVDQQARKELGKNAPIQAPLELRNCLVDGERLGLKTACLADDGVGA